MSGGVLKWGDPFTAGCFIFQNFMGKPMKMIENGWYPHWWKPSYGEPMLAIQHIDRPDLRPAFRSKREPTPFCGRKPWKPRLPHGELKAKALKMGATSYSKRNFRYNLMGICKYNIYSCIFWGYRRGIIWMRWAWTWENWGYNGMHCIAKRFSDSHTIMAIWKRTNQQYDVGFVLKACRIYGMSNRDKMIHQQILGHCTLFFEIETRQTHPFECCVALVPSTEKDSFHFLPIDGNNILDLKPPILTMTPENLLCSNIAMENRHV